jgi:hypothetical protein
MASTAAASVPRVCRVVTPEWAAWACLALVCAGGPAATVLLVVPPRRAALRIAGIVCALVALVAGLHADAFFRGQLWSTACTPKFKAGMLAAETLTALFILAWAAIAIAIAAGALPAA